MCSVILLLLWSPPAPEFGEEEPVMWPTCVAIAAITGITWCVPARLRWRCLLGAVLLIVTAVLFAVYRVFEVTVWTVL